jgi:hypothetical protein
MTLDKKMRKNSGISILIFTFEIMLLIGFMVSFVASTYIVANTYIKREQSVIQADILSAAGMRYGKFLYEKGQLPFSLKQKIKILNTSDFILLSIHHPSKRSISSQGEVNGNTGQRIEGRLP